MQSSLRKWHKALSPYRDIFVFVITLLAANYFWKFTVLGDDGDRIVTWFGIDITAPFDYMVRHITTVVYAVISLFRDTCTQVSYNAFVFDSGVGTRIVWSCTALKQTFIWLCLMLITRGAWRHKAWFILLGIACIYLFNILRIVLIALLTESHPEWFEFLHTILFKYLFYAMLFALWVWFVERIRYVGMKKR